ncbi:hypothetical protein BH10PAT1_BH10PAT1_2800 [soil metagenome]
MQVERDVFSVSKKHLTGYSKVYRGNHRSDNRGMGFRAFMRNNWMKVYNPIMKVNK